MGNVSKLGDPWNHLELAIDLVSCVRDGIPWKFLMKSKSCWNTHTIPSLQGGLVYTPPPKFNIDTQKFAIFQAGVTKKNGIQPVSFQGFRPDLLFFSGWPKRNDQTMPDAWNRQQTSKPGRSIKKPRKWMNPGWQTPCKSMKKKVGGMSQPKNSQALKMTVDFCHTPLPVFFCLIRLFFCLSKTIWSSLGILVLSVGCFSFCGMKSCESWWPWVWYTIQTLHGTYGSRTYASQLNTQEDRRLERAWKDDIIL